MKNTFLGLDRILLTKTCSPAGDVLPRSSLQIKQPWLELRFISELSQLDIQWFGTAPVSKEIPIGSHLPAAKLWSILLETLSGTTCSALNLKTLPCRQPLPFSHI